MTTKIKHIYPEKEEDYTFGHYIIDIMNQFGITPTEAQINLVTKSPYAPKPETYN